MPSSRAAPAHRPRAGLPPRAQAGAGGVAAGGLLCTGRTDGKGHGHMLGGDTPGHQAAVQESDGLTEAHTQTTRAPGEGNSLSPVTGRKVGSVCSVPRS